MRYLYTSINIEITSLISKKENVFFGRSAASKFAAPNTPPPLVAPLNSGLNLFLTGGYDWSQCRSTPTSGPPKVSARAAAHRSYHFKGVKLKSCIKKIHHNLYKSKQANVRIKHADTEGSSHKKFGTDARVQ